VVCLLVNGLADAPQVASATLLDLAARRMVEIHEVGAGAENTLVRLGRDTLPESAPAYERRIVQRVAATAGRAFTPVAEFVRTYADGGFNWQRRLVRDALLDARQRGLVTRSGSACSSAWWRRRSPWRRCWRPWCPARSPPASAGQIVVRVTASDGVHELHLDAAQGGPGHLPDLFVVPGQGMVGGVSPGVMMTPVDMRF
jgi:hypothetical protein